MRIIAALLLAVAALSCRTSASVGEQRDSSRDSTSRSRVEATRGWPLRRPLPPVMVHPARRSTIVVPDEFLTPVRWADAIATPPSEAIVWLDSQTLRRRDDWTEFTLDVRGSARRLYFDVDREVQLEFAEVVFANGEAQVVDFARRLPDPGMYTLIAFGDRRRIDHVRMVARAMSPEARVVLQMES